MSKILYHTTSLVDAANIVKDKLLAPRDSDSFVSLSERPIFRGDIRQHGAILVINASKINDLEKVEYTRTWYNTHRDQSRYIAGDGWEQQYEIPEELLEPPDDLDPDEVDDWEPDEEDLEADREQAEFDAFDAKSDEREWISKHVGSDVDLPAGSIIKIAVPTEHVSQATAMLPGIKIISYDSLSGQAIKEAAIIASKYYRT